MANSFDLATGYVTFKGDFDKFEDDLKAAQEKTEALNDAMASGKFGLAAYEAKRINKEMADANRNAKKMMDTINLGKFGVLVRDFNNGLNKFSANAAKFGAGATGIGGAALAAGSGGSPLAKSTLQGSFDLLMTEFGGTFTPLVKDVSRGLQDLRKTFRDLSPEVKGLINEGAKFIGIAGLAALGLAAVAKGFTLIAAHPLIALLAAGAGVLGAQEGKLNNENRKITNAKNSIYGTTAEDAAKGWQGQRLAGMQPDDAKAESQRLFNSKWKEYEFARNAHLTETTGARGLLTSQEDKDKLAAKALVSGRELEEAKFNLNKYAGAGLKKREGGVAKDEMLLGSAGPASMTDVAGLFKSFQMAGAGGNQLEAEQRKVEMENQQRLLDNSNTQTQLLGRIAENLPVAR